LFLVLNFIYLNKYILYYYEKHFWYQIILKIICSCTYTKVGKMPKFSCILIIVDKHFFKIKMEIIYCSHMLMFPSLFLFLRLIKLVMRRNVEHKTEMEQKFGNDKNNVIFVLSYSLYLYTYIILFIQTLYICI